MQNPQHHDSTYNAPTMKLGLIPVPRPSELRLKRNGNWRSSSKLLKQKRRWLCEDEALTDFPQKKSLALCEAEALSEHSEGWDYPQDDVSADSCSTSTVSGSHDSDSPSWLREADFDADYEFDCDHAGVVNEESYIEFDHDRTNDFEEVLEALSVDL